MEIQIFTEQKNTKKLKELYVKALSIKSAIPHPRIMGIIRECGGKMHMHERLWSEAATDFFEVCCQPQDLNPELWVNTSPSLDRPTFTQLHTYYPSENDALHIVHLPKSVYPASL